MSRFDSAASAIPLLPRSNARVQIRGVFYATRTLPALYVRREGRGFSVTADSAAARLWQQFVDAPAEDKLLTIDATDPRVLRLPWEVLADEGGHIFAQGIGVRRRLQQATRAAVRTFALPVRVLVVVARPDDAGFIDSRAVSEPLLDALDELGARTEVEFLFPPTLKALTARRSGGRSWSTCWSAWAGTRSR